MEYILGIDQSTQGTKAVLFDGQARIVGRADIGHKQIINEKGWISHDPEEIYTNLLRAVRQAVECSGIDKRLIRAVGISNQRETTLLWDQEGKPIGHAVVWQCARASQIAERLREKASLIYEKTGLVLSAYFPAAKMRWLLENELSGQKGDVQEGDMRGLHLGTVDSWLVYKLTRGKKFLTDSSNASRTQLFNLRTCSWDEELCSLFGVPMELLPQIRDSDACFGQTDFEGFLEEEIPIHSVLGDSHAALFGQGCHRPGMVKTTYGTGSSIMMNVGKELVASRSGLAASLAWSRGGQPEYVLEGNINYTGAVITWLKDNLGLIASAQEVQGLAEKANREDGTILVPAFSGLSAPYWLSDARAMICGISRTTGKAELAKAALESIAYQITDVLEAMEKDSGVSIRELRVDGGPTKNGYLMQFQSDISGKTVLVAGNEAASVSGAAYLAGIAEGIYDEHSLFDKQEFTEYRPMMSQKTKEEKRGAWKNAVEMVLRDGRRDVPEH